MLSVFIGGFLLVRFAGVTFSCAVYTHANISSWFDDQKHVLVIVLRACSCCVLMSLFVVSSSLGDAASFIFGYSNAVNFGGH